MKRSEMVLNIASELVHSYTNFLSFDKAQELAELILSRIEKDGVLPPAYSYLNINLRNWEPEDSLPKPKVV